MDSLQQRAFDAFRDGRSVALLGSAGSGKSFLMNKMISWAKEKYQQPDAVVACALTNNAAEAIGGMTIHNTFNALPSWRFSDDRLLHRVLARKDVSDRIMRMKVLVIDEISMLKAHELDAIEYVLRILTSSEKDAAFPFARRQLVFAGDPFQLEPVKLFEKDRANMTAYEGRSWRRVFGGDGMGVIALLQANHRQRADNTFFEALTRMRRGVQTDIDLATINATSHHHCDPPAGHLRLCLKKKSVADITRERLGSLRSKLYVSNHADNFSDDSYRDALICMIKKRLDDAAPRRVMLKRGAAIMLTRKVADNLPGTRCVVLDIGSKPLDVNVSQVDGGVVCARQASETLLKVVTLSSPEKPSQTLEVRFMAFEVHRDDGTVLATRYQLPVIPAYALTIHRSQGLSFDNVAIDFSEMMKQGWIPAGAAYVALSRCRTTAGLWVKGLHHHCIKVSLRAQRFLIYVGKIAQLYPNRVLKVSDEADCGKENRDISTASNAVIQNRIQDRNTTTLLPGNKLYELSECQNDGAPKKRPRVE